MQKKILVAIDDSSHSRQAVDYAARMKTLIPGLGFTLVHIQPPVSQFLLDEAKRSSQAQAELNRAAARNAEAARGLLAKYKDLMVRAGFTSVFLGIETTDVDSLVGAGKLQNVTVDLDEACRRINRAGLQITAGCIIGFDQE